MSETMYSPQFVDYHGQRFLVAIEGDTLTLVVVNKDGSHKKLPVSVSITPADAPNEAKQSLIERGLLVQNKFQCRLGGEHITINARRKGEEKDEKKWLKQKAADWLIDRGLNGLFPGNRHVQYAE